MHLKNIDVSKPLEAYDEVLANAKNQGREPNTADRMLAMRAAILAYEADKSNVLPPTRGTDSQLDADDPALLAIVGRALADRHADACGVNRDDNWQFYSGEFIVDAKLALDAVCRFRAQGGDTKDPRK